MRTNRKRGKGSSTRKMRENAASLDIMVGETPAKRGPKGGSTGNAKSLRSGGKRKSLKRAKRKKRAVANSTVAGITDDTPTTSTNVNPKDRRYKNFKNNLSSKKQFRKAAAKFLNSSSKVPSTSQFATRKLLRSIKRRQHQRSKTPKRRLDLRRKLNFQTHEPATENPPTEHAEEATIKPTTSAKTHSAATLEEGELCSDDENETQLQLQTSGRDDDCICIEPHIEEIIIDDDTPTTSHESDYKSDLRKFALHMKSTAQLLTSTPCDKLKTNVASAPGSPAAAACDNNVPLKFFEDLSGVPWFETIRSDDTFSNYTKLSTLRAKSTRKRRSKRQMARLRASESDDVIVIDETLGDSTLVPAKKRKSSEMDDSVVFVSETNRNAFIPLESADVPNPIKVVRNPFTPRKTRAKTVTTNDLFTASEKKQLDAYNDNAYNPSADTPAQTQTKRMILIDGSNVAFNHALNKGFSVKGLQIVIEYFEKMGHDVKAVLPQFRLQMNKSTDPEKLKQLHRAGKIVLTPCKNLPGKSSISYDDRFVLQLACELDAAVVSNDNYRDLLNENSAFKKIIENRVIGYSWCNDIFILPKDPYGRWGPTLQSILNRV